MARGCRTTFTKIPDILIPMHKNKISQNILFLLLLACYAIVLMAPLSSNTTFPVNEDYFNHFLAIKDAKNALLQGQFPLRVFSNHHEWMYPYFQFYSSTTYTIAGLIQIITGDNPIIAFKITLFIFLIFGGCYMYRFANIFLQSEHVAILSSICYISAPYILLTMNHLGALNETIALLILPAVLFYTLERYDFPHKISNFLWMTFFWYMLATIHLVTFVLSSFFIGIFFIWISLSQKKYINLINTGIAYIFACFLSFWQLAPMFLFANNLNVHTSYQSSAIFFLKSPTFYQLISPIGNVGNELYKISTELNTIMMMHPNVGIPMLLGFCLSCFALFKKIKAHARIDNILLSLVVLFIFAFFLSWTPFNFWHLLPESFRFFQYPYRILGQLIWIGSLLFGFFILWLFPKKLNLTELGIGILLILACSSYWLFERQLYGITSLQLVKYYNFNSDYLMNTNNGTVDYKILSQHTSLKKLKPMIIEPHPLTSFFIVFEGSISKVDKKNKLGLFINGMLFKSKALKENTISWSEEISPFDKMEIVTFQLIDSQNKIMHDGPDIMVKYIQSRGFVNHENMLTLNDIKPHCVSRSNHVYCHLFVSPNITRLELPVYYSPEMLDIFVNGKKVFYQSIYYKNYLLATIIPTPGKNDIHIHFRGLWWANFLSLFFWGLWLMIFALSLTRWRK